MNSRTIITGPPLTGKTSLAFNLSDTYQNPYIGYGSELKHPFFLSALEEENDVIVIDNIKNIIDALRFFHGEVIQINRNGIKPVIFPTPHLILVCESIKGVKIDKRYYTIVELENTKNAQ